MSKWLQMVQFECPRHSKSSAWLRLGEIHFPISSLCTNNIFHILQLFHFYTGRPILITPERGRLKMGKWKSPNLSEKQGIGCPGHSNWTICSLLSQFYLPNFTTFSLLYWEANSYYPRGLIMGKGNSSNSRNGLDRGV